jgi:putative tryptophan/tyrosine transport system substrate-binding protein
MRRRRILAGLLLPLVAAPLVAAAQPAGKVYRVGYLATDSGPVAAGPPPSEVFRQRLRELGWVDGQNIAIEFRSAEGRIDRLPSLAEEFVRLKVDVIYVPGGTPAARAAREATSTIPIVVGGVADPVRSGLVSSLVRPGGNLTGLSLQSSDLGPKRLELLKQAVPAASRVAYLKAPGQQAEAAEQFWKDLNTVARSLQMKIHRMEVQGPDDFSRAFAQMAQDRTDSLLVD